MLKTFLCFYTSIPHKEGLDTCRETLDTRGVIDPPTDDVINLINLELKRNNFTFDSTHYLQKHGTAMGTRMVPLYANLFMGQLERDLLQQVEKKTHNLVEIHKRHLNYLATRGRKAEKVYPSNRFPPQNDQIHC